MPRLVAKVHAFPHSHTQPQFTMQASYNFGSPLTLFENFRPSLLPTFNATHILVHPPLQSELQTHNITSDDNYAAPLDVHSQNDGNACTLVDVEQSKTPSRKRASATKEKSQQNEAACKKQTKAKEQRQKLADGDTFIFKDHWSMDDFRVLADAKLRLNKEMAEARGKNQILSLDERWRRVSNWCKAAKVNKSALQCRDKCKNTFPKYKKIHDCNRAMPSRKNSYALMTADERVEENLNSTTKMAGTSSVFPGPVSSPPAMGDTLQSETPCVDPSSTDKRSRCENKATSVKNCLQVLNKNMVESIERTQREQREQQKRQEELERRQFKEILSLQQ
ncbi:hypothetical protein L7F22_000136 [Adiantum nelumboides]|nr:hypothetical protein [Adiantum nelumboides]